MDDHEQRNLESLARSNRKLLKQLGFWHSFWRGVISGIGATVGAAIVLTVVAWLLHQLAGVDFFKPAVDRALPYIDSATDRFGPANSSATLSEPTYLTNSPSPSPEISPSVPVPTPTASPEF